MCARVERWLSEGVLLSARQKHVTWRSCILLADTRGGQGYISPESAATSACQHTNTATRTHSWVFYSPRSTTVLSWPCAPSFCLKFPPFFSSCLNPVLLIKTWPPQRSRSRLSHLVHAFILPSVSISSSPPPLPMSNSLTTAAPTYCAVWYESMFSISGRLAQTLKGKLQK